MKRTNYIFLILFFSVTVLSCPKKIDMPKELSEEDVSKMVMIAAVKNKLDLFFINYYSSRKPLLEKKAVTIENRRTGKMEKGFEYTRESVKKILKYGVRLVYGTHKCSEKQVYVFVKLNKKWVLDDHFIKASSYSCKI